MTNLVAELNKANTAGYSFTMENWIQPDVRDINKPSLLSSLVGVNFESNVQETFIYDITEKTAQLPGVKGYTENGPDQDHDPARQVSFIIPSFGTGYRVQVADWDRKRKPGGRPDETMTEADAVALQSDKITDSWDLHTELGISQLITDDTNLLANDGTQSIFPQYDMSLSINGASRAAAPDLDLGNVTDAVAHRQVMRGYRKGLQQELGKLGKNASGYICICGDTFFDGQLKIEAQVNLNRELRATVDLASMQVGELNTGGFIFDNFQGSDGVWYVNYGSEIIGGTKLIGDDDAYMMPIGVEDMFTVQLSPAKRRFTAGRPAQSMYMFAKEDDFGVQMVTESNRLYFNRHPQLIQPLTTST